MRVISGQAKGRLLTAPRGFITRPTSDRVKEAIFNVLAPKIMGSHVLDAFAGSGALGIEALSRGAEHVVFIEKRREAWLTVKKNLALTGFDGRAEVFMGDFASVLSCLEERFDLIFLDPPYNEGLIQKAVSLIIDSGLLKSEGVIIIETASKFQELPTKEEITLKKESVYGDTAVLYYQYR
ncbi:MAG: 16S rRNA (guanine(966)-N(2))-methyltransferase RsmD [Bacillota bacterium]